MMCDEHDNGTNYLSQWASYSRYWRKDLTTKDYQYQSGCVAHTMNIARMEELMATNDKMTDAEHWCSAPMYSRGEISKVAKLDGDCYVFADGSRVVRDGESWGIGTTNVLAETHYRNQFVGTKGDKTKPRWSLLPLKTIAQVIKVLEFGAAKYSVGNWERVDDPKRRYYDAAMRHIDAWWGGEMNDKESGLPHLAHATACLLFLMWFDGKQVE